MNKYVELIQEIQEVLNSKDDEINIKMEELRILDERIEKLENELSMMRPESDLNDIKNVIVNFSGETKIYKLLISGIFLIMVLFGIVPSTFEMINNSTNTNLVIINTLLIESGILTFGAFAFYFAATHYLRKIKKDNNLEDIKEELEKRKNIEKEISQSLSKKESLNCDIKEIKNTIVNYSEQFKIVTNKLLSLSEIVDKNTGLINELNKNYESDQSLVELEESLKRTRINSSVIDKKVL